MVYFLTATALVLHTYFWGAGLALLCPGRLPRTCRWILAPAWGISLQSAVVWAAAHTPLSGTNQYAWWSELLPLGLLVIGIIRHGGRMGLSGLLRPSAVLLGGIMLGNGWFLLSPMAAAGRGLSSSSLGSCDHADYAAGARVLAEFSQGDRTGMLGLVEVTRVGSADYLFDYWLRLNHFTPSALIAHHSAVLGLAAYRLVSVFAAVLLLFNIPLVYLLSRVVGRLGQGSALFVAGLYGLSPLSAYAVHQGALGQILGAHGIALLLLALVFLFRTAGSARTPWSVGGMALAGFWILAGSYNFILVVCLAQPGLWLVGQTLLDTPRRRFARVALVTTCALGACLVLFWGRFSGVIERFQLLIEHDYGWTVPLVTWEGWLGLVGDIYLEPIPPAWRGLLMLALAWAVLVSLFRLWRTRWADLIAPAALILPVLIGWTILAWSSFQRANASYDAFKLVSVFYPGLLVGFCALLLGRGRLAWGKMAFMAGILAFNLIRAEEFRAKMSAPPLRVDRHQVGLGRIEGMPVVASVNVRVGFYWARMWADTFLLRTPHYFEQPTYEGGNVTPLWGEWDLRYTLLRVLPAQPQNRVELGPNFYLVRPGEIASVIAEFGSGWFEPERFGTDQWRWTRSGGGEILITNFRADPLTVTLRCQMAGVESDGKGEIYYQGQQVLTGRLNPVPAWTEPVALILPPGQTVIRLAPAGLGPRLVAGDSRELGVALYTFELSLPDLAGR